MIALINTDSEKFFPFEAVVIIPEPIGLVSIKWSPGFALLIVIYSPVLNNQVIAIPNLGSWLTIVWPPIIENPDSLALLVAPLIISTKNFLSTSLG